MRPPWDTSPDRPRFWRPQASILEPPGLDFGASSLDFEASRLDCGASKPPAFLWLCFPHSATQLDKCGTDLLPGVPSFSALAFLKGLAKVWEAAVSPLGGLQWNRNCHIRKQLCRYQTIFLSRNSFYE